MWKPFAFALTLTAAPLHASECPAVPDNDATLDGLYDALLEADSEMAAREFNSQLWGIWTEAPGEAAQGLLDMGMSQRSSFDLLGSVQSLTTLIDYCPAYAEGWNQRAFSYYLAGDYDRALPDLEEALALRPRHLGALTGKALTLIQLQRPAEAVLVLREALALNPWLSERHLLPALEAQEQEL